MKLLLWLNTDKETIELVFRQTGSIFLCALETLTIVKDTPLKGKTMLTPIPESIMLEAIDKNQLNTLPEEMTGMYWDEEAELRAIVYGEKESYIPYI